MQSTTMTARSGIHYRSIGIATVAIAGLPTLWNIVARNEYRRHTMEKAVGSKKAAAYVLAAAIFVASGLRDCTFHNAMTQNPSSVFPILSTHFFGPQNAGALRRFMRGFGAALMAAGTTLVVSSFLRLGITGTYLGDYFGILMDQRVTAFPFSHFDNPMYLGATLNFLAASIAQNNGVGALLTGLVALVYHVSTKYFENPFTAMIYRKRSEERAATGVSASMKKQ